MFSKMHFQLISENEFFREIKSDGMTSFVDSMLAHNRSQLQAIVSMFARYTIFDINISLPQDVQCIFRYMGVYKM